MKINIRFVSILFICLLAVSFQSRVLAQKCNTLIPYKVGKYWGYSDLSGKLLIAPKYDRADLFYSGTAVVYKSFANNKFYSTRIDTLGHEAVPLKFASVSPILGDGVYNLFYELRFGRSTYYRSLLAENTDPGVRHQMDSLKIPFYFIVEDVKTRKFGIYLASENKLVVSCLYTSIRLLTYKDKHLVFEVNQNNNYGLVDEGGKVLAEPIYQSIYTTLSKANRQDSIVLIKRHIPMPVIKEEEEANIVMLSSDIYRMGLVIVKDSITRRFFVTGINNNALFANYDSIAWYSNYEKMYLRIRKDRLWGLADIKGNILLPVQYDGIEEYQNSSDEIFAKVKLNDHFGIVTNNNQVIVPIEYDSIYHEEGVASQPYSFFANHLKKGGKWGLYDSKFRIIVPHLYDNIGECYYNNSEHTDYECVVLKNGKWGVVDEDGKEVIPFKFTDVLRIVPYIKFRLALLSKPSNYYSGVYFIDKPKSSIYNSKNRIEIDTWQSFMYKCESKKEFALIKVMGDNGMLYYMNNSGFEYRK